MIHLLLHLFDPPKKGKIFINYRRSDSLGFAGRLTDNLQSIFAEERVFRDVEGIKGGEKFDRVIQDTLTESPCLLVVIGPEWVETKDVAGNLRLHNVGDWVADEIAFCLSKSIPIIPVLLQGTPMPHPSQLPDKLKGLCLHNAVHLDDNGWDADVKKIADLIAEKIPGTRASAVLKRARWIIPGVLLLGVLISSGFMASSQEFGTAMISPTWIAIGLITVYITHIGNFCQKKSQHFLNLAAAAGVLGGIITGVLFFLDSTDKLEANMGYWSGLATVLLMLSLTIISGLKAK